MKIQVLNDDGSVAFGYDTSVATEQTFPNLADRPLIANALHDAQSFLGSDQHIITSIRSDISAAIGRIELELGAHPAFTWAQTKLGNAVAHLEAFIAGSWTEPQQEIIPAGTAYDARGLLVKVDQPTIATAAEAQSTTVAS